MLKPLQNYQAEANRKLTDTWYDFRYMYFGGGTGYYSMEVGDNNRWSHDFASVDPKTDEVVGIIRYRTDWEAMSATNFGMCSFDFGNLIFARDLHQCVKDIFEKYRFNRMEWVCFIDNPIFTTYKRFIEKYGGRIVGIRKECSKLQDGKLHDDAIFELMRSSYVMSKVKMHKYRKGDKVTIVSRKSNHYYKVGSSYIIKEVEGDTYDNTVVYFEPRIITEDVSKPVSIVDIMSPDLIALF